MSDNANQPASRPNTENGGNTGHYEQGGYRGNRSGSHYNNRRRRPSQQIGGGQESGNRERTQGNPAAAQKPQSNQQSPSGQPGQPSAKQPNANRPPRQDSYHDKRGGGRRPNQGGAQQASQTPNAQNSGGQPQQANAPFTSQNSGGQPQQASAPFTSPHGRSGERQDQNAAAKQERNQEQTAGMRKGNPNAAPRTDRPERTDRSERGERPERTERPREGRNWGRNIRTEETYEDIKRDNERIEKEIWLEIAGIHTYKLD